MTCPTRIFLAVRKRLECKFARFGLSALMLAARWSVVISISWDAVGLNRAAPYTKTLARGFFGVTPRVAFYGATPQDNSSGVYFLRLQLLEYASTNRLILVPHLTARGPNRAWVIERGPRHPLVRTAESRMAYVLACAGRPIEILEQDSDSVWNWVRMLELFTSRTAATSIAEEMNESDGELASGEGDPAHVMELSGELLLEHIARMERLEVVLDTSPEERQVFDVRELDDCDADHRMLFDELMALLPMRAGIKEQP